MSTPETSDHLDALAELRSVSDELSQQMQISRVGQPDLDDEYVKANTQEVELNNKHLELSPEQRTQLQKFTEKLYKTIPEKAWGELIGISAFGTFRKEYLRLLEHYRTTPDSGSIDAFAKDKVASGLSSIYIIKSENAQLGDSESAAYKAHSPEAVAALKTKLVELSENLDQELSTIPDFIRDEYRIELEDQIAYCDIIPHIGTPEFTNRQRPERIWRQYLDESAVEQNQVILKFEKDALYILENNTDQKEKYSTIGDALDTWNFTPHELAELHLSEDGRLAVTFEADRIVDLFQVLLARSDKLNQWKVIQDPTTVAVDVDAGSRTVRIPPERVMTPDDVAFIPAHELLHVSRNENGDRQAVGILRTGMAGASTSEEGIAVIAEMFRGEPYGHARQLKLAARYYAIAMALKTKETENGPIAQYSVQEIYNTLRGYNISQKDASDIIWRIQRGTSLTRQVTTITVDGHALPVAETYMKDLIYFQGMREVFETLFSKLSLTENDQERLKLVNTRDFSDRLLARVGRFFLGGERDRDSSIPTTQERSQTSVSSDFGSKEKYKALVSLGNEKLLHLIQTMAAGGTNLKTLQQIPGWNDIIIQDPEKLVQLARLYGAEKI
ncbi:MAG: tyrosine/phenylalanine carboxypeptidase domain-containing protein [Candidatus Woesebacteria bacterium]